MHKLFFNFEKKQEIVELTEKGRNLKFKEHGDIDIFDSLTDEEKENLYLHN